jgi:tetratricopeptide (TPR) repeat protein
VRNLLSVTLTLLLTVNLSLGADLKELMRRANLLFNEGKYEESLKVYNELLREGAPTASVYNNIGVIYVKLYEKTGIEEYIKKAISFFTLATVVDHNYRVAERNLNEVLDTYLSEKVKRNVSLELKRKERKKTETKVKVVEKRIPAYQPISNEEVLKFLQRWREFWEKKDDGYFELYSPKGCMDFERFVRYKKRIWKRSQNIKVRIEDLHIRRNPDNSVCVTFRQLYSSSIMKSKARKALCLRKENGIIRIYCEWFIPTVRIE